MFLFAGCIAALTAYMLNRYLVNRFGADTIVYLTPIIEECLKTGLAVFFQTAIVPVHLVFGLIEGVYDLATSRMGMAAGILSLIWHASFGLVTVFLSSMMGHVVYGLVAATFLHYLGNRGIVKPKEE